MNGKNQFPPFVDQPGCEAHGEGHCATCGDEAVSARILSIESAFSTALVEIAGTTAEVDISLIDEVSTGDRVLVHGGVAIALDIPRSPLECEIKDVC
jgi:hypothetical protein